MTARAGRKASTPQPFIFCTDQSKLNKHCKSAVRASSGFFLDALVACAPWAASMLNNCFNPTTVWPANSMAFNWSASLLAVTAEGIDIHGETSCPARGLRAGGGGGGSRKGRRGPPKRVRRGPLERRAEPTLSWDFGPTARAIWQKAVGHQFTSRQAPWPKPHPEHPTTRPKHLS